MANKRCKLFWNPIFHSCKGGIWNEAQDNARKADWNGNRHMMLICIDSDSHGNHLFDTNPNDSASGSRSHVDDIAV